MSPASKNKPEGCWPLARKQPALWNRARILQSIRDFFASRGFLEVETPQRIPANAPEAYIVPLASGAWCLQTSPELCMKRLLAAGYPKLFQICHCFRQEERGSRHLPEFTLLEWYEAGADYRRQMRDCEDLLAALLPDLELTWRGRRVNLMPPWERLSVADAFDSYASCSLEEALEEGRFDAVMGVEIEPRLGMMRPTLLYDYPAEKAALARRKADNPRFAERFELYILGMELANGFSELTDSQEQRRRFEEEERIRRSDGQRPYPLPEKFLEELGAMPDAAGIALGIDRLIMLLTDSSSIDDVVAFPPELL